MMRYLRGSLGALCVLLLLSASGVLAAPATNTYTSSQYHYRLTYPTAWVRVGVSQSDFAAYSPNRNAVVSTFVSPGSAGEAELRTALRKVFAPFGRPENAVSYRSLRLGSVPAVLAKDLVSTLHGRRGAVIAMAASYHGNLYTLISVIQDVGMPTAAGDLTALNAIINSTRFL